MEFWQKIKTTLESKNQVALLYVLESNGSSPGRQGFKMMVSENGDLFGSIGGGMMEYNLVELCKERLKKEHNLPILKQQIHRENTNDSSGLICSGDQIVGIYFLNQKYNGLIDSIIDAIQTKKFGLLNLTDSKIDLISNQTLDKKFRFTNSLTHWDFQEDLGYYPILHIIGGGHVSQALAKFAPDLGFKIIVYDDRNNLNTFSKNAEIRYISDYGNIAEIIPHGNRHYVVIMSFMYKSDLTIVQQLLPMNFKYLGLMGSKNKIRMLKKELILKKIPNLEKLHAPIGIQISSQTPTEIAISILGEMIRVKNSSLS